MLKRLFLLAMLVGLSTSRLSAADPEAPKLEAPDVPDDVAIEPSDYDKIIDDIGYRVAEASPVIWILDQSPSMKDDIAEVQRRVSEWLEKIKDTTAVGVVAFSDKPTVLLRPTRDRAKIRQAFAAYTTKEGGNENAYTAIAAALKMMTRGQNRALILATDEAGDDQKYLSWAMKAVASRRIQVFVISPNATFGNQTWKWTETDFTKRDTQHLHSENGPETATSEALFDFHFVQRATWTRLVFPMEQRIWAMKAGWAPYGLQVLADKSGGRVYEMDARTYKLETEFESKERYRPDFDLPTKVLSNLKRNPWRKAVYQAALYWQKNFKEIDRDIFPAYDKAALVAGLTKQLPIIQGNIKVADSVLKSLRTAMKTTYGGETAAAESSSATSLRWRANIELAYASASVARYHLHQFVEDLQRFKQPKYEPPGVGVAGRDVVGFQILAVPGPLRSEGSPGDGGATVVISDADGLEPVLPVDEPGNGGKGLKEMPTVADHVPARTLADMRRQAEAALDVVAHNHPRTPWAAMAEELKSQLGYYEPQAIYRGPWTQGKSTN